MPYKRSKTAKTAKKNTVPKIFTSLANTFRWENIKVALRFVAFTASFVLVAYSVIELSTVFLRTDIVPDVSTPVSRFVASVDFKERKVSLDATISKVYSAPKDITIWRFGDGNVVKSTSRGDIADQELVEYVFEKPGTYTIGYSIIDEDNLSDEATCTISFADGYEQLNPDTDEIEYIKTLEDIVYADCGKSYTEYNSINNIYSINTNRRLIRHSILYIIVAILVLLYTVLFLKKEKKKQS